MIWLLTAVKVQMPGGLEATGGGYKQYETSSSHRQDCVVWISMLCFSGIMKQWHTGPPVVSVHLNSLFLTLHYMLNLNTRVSLIL